MRSVLAGVMALGAVAGCRGYESESPPVHLIHNMDTQEKGKAYRRDTSGLFADGRLMRAPPEGTVAVGTLDEDDLFFRGANEKGEPSKEFPPALKDGGNALTHVVERGHGRYVIYCAPCHGAQGDGQGPVAQRGGLLVPPPAMTTDRLKEMVVGKIFSAITYGVNNGNMPSYAAQIPADDRWAIVAYIRSMQQVALENEGTVVAVDTSKPSPEWGLAVFKGKGGCNACHSTDGSKLVGPTFKGIWGRSEKTSGGDVTVDLAYVTESIRSPNAKVVEGYPPAMPPRPDLTETEIESLALFMQTLK